MIIICWHDDSFNQMIYLERESEKNGWWQNIRLKEVVKNRTTTTTIQKLGQLYHNRYPDSGIFDAIQRKFCWNWNMSILFVCFILYTHSTYTESFNNNNNNKYPKQQPEEKKRKQKLKKTDQMMNGSTKESHCATTTTTTTIDNSKKIKKKPN